MALSYETLNAYIDGLYGDGILTTQEYNDIILYILANGEISTSARDLIQVRRGNLADLPVLAQGEIGFTLDEENMYVGGINGNVDIGNKDIINQHSAQLADIAYNIKNFGATGDGITDDTVAIQLAITNAVAYKKPLFIPFGTYIISDELIIPSSTVSFEMFGVEGSILYLKSATNKTLIYCADSTDLSFKNFEMDGNKTNQVQGVWPHAICAAILPIRCGNVTIENCKFKNFFYGISPGGAYTGFNSKVLNNYFNNVDDGIDMYSIGCTIIGNIFKDCIGNCIQIEPNFGISDSIPDYRNEPNFGQISVGNVISNNVMMDVGTGIRIHKGTIDCVIDGNVITNAVINGIACYFVESKNVTISNNIITNVTTVGVKEPFVIEGAGILLSNTKAINLIGNTVNYAHVGIYIYLGTMVNISDNIVRYCRTSGICVYSCDGIKVSNNYMVDNHTTDVWYANGGIFLINSTSCHISNNFTKDSLALQKACVVIHSGNSELIISENKSKGTLSGDVHTTTGSYSTNMNKTIFTPSNPVDFIDSIKIASQLIGKGTIVPTTGNYIKGDIIYDSSPVSNGFIGWVCVTSGTPGTWKTFGVISA